MICARNLLLTFMMVVCSVAAIVLAPEVCISVYCVWRTGGAIRGALPHRVLHATLVHIFAELL